MKAVVFAAGLGTRLRPLTDRIPKPLIDIRGRSILERTLDVLPDAVSETIIVVGYKGDMLRERLAARNGVTFVEQPELRGTYDALLRAQAFLGEASFLALNGDDLYAKEDLMTLTQAEPFAMLIHRVPTPNPYSHLESEGGFLKRIIPNKLAAKLDAHDVYVGACLLDGRFFALESAVLPNGEFGLPQTLEKHLASHPVRVMPSSFWLPVGTFEELETARRQLPA